MEPTMFQVMAYYNWASGWIWDCPKCNDSPYDGTVPKVSELAVEGMPGVCSRCHPGILATLPVVVDGNPTTIPDLAARAGTRRKAASLGEAYEVVFPVDREQIMEVLMRRPEASQRAWWPAFTVDDLRRENAERGIA
jgi:hypothetical protein